MCVGQAIRDVQPNTEAQHDLILCDSGDDFAGSPSTQLFFRPVARVFLVPHDVHNQDTALKAPRKLLVSDKRTNRIVGPVRNKSATGDP
ncbi:hypothetical protein D3C85_1640310 [compost metagenome]